MTTPTTPTDRKAVLLRNRRLLEENLADVALIHERSPSADTETQLQQARAELQRAEQAILNFDLARTAEAREQSAAEKKANKSALADLNKRIAALHKATSTNAVSLIADIEALGPRYATLIADLAELRELTAAALRTAGGSKAVHRAMGHGRHWDGHAQLGDAVAHAIASAGFGQVGPSLAPTVVVQPLGRSFVARPIGEALERLHIQRVRAIESAANPEEA